MQIDVTGDEIPLTDSLREHAQRRIERVFARNCEHPAHCHVILSQVRHLYSAELVVNHIGRNFRAAGVADDMYAAIDAAAAKLRRQLADTASRKRPRALSA